MKIKSSNSIGLLLAVIILLGVGAYVFISMSNTRNSEPKAVFEEGSLKISSEFGTALELASIKSIKLKDTIPAIKSKDGGSWLGDICRGRFTLEGMGQGRLYIRSNIKPFVYIYTKDSFVIVNFKDPNATKKLFEDLKKETGK